jgi:hypothetical protein
LLRCHRTRRSSFQTPLSCHIVGGSTTLSKCQHLFCLAAMPIFTHTELGIPPWQDQSISPKDLSPWNSKELLKSYDSFSAVEKMMSATTPKWYVENAQSHLRVRIYEVVHYFQANNRKKVIFQVRNSSAQQKKGHFPGEKLECMSLKNIGKAATQVTWLRVAALRQVCWP